LANTQAKGQAQVVGSILQPEQYAIAFPLDSSNRKEVNMALLESYQNGAYQEIHAKWFGE
jgi:glutamine transport system substrate-binding protein